MGVAINEAPKAAINCWRPAYCVRASQNCAHINGHSSFQRALWRSFDNCATPENIEQRFKGCEEYTLSIAKFYPSGRGL
jgi:hypothetical protein